MKIKLNTEKFIKEIKKFNKQMRERFLINNPKSYAKFTRTN